jgi:hypothetical protein
MCGKYAFFLERGAVVNKTILLSAMTVHICPVSLRSMLKTQANRVRISS